VALDLSPTRAFLRTSGGEKRIDASAVSYRQAAGVRPSAHADASVVVSSSGIDDLAQGRREGRVGAEFSPGPPVRVVAVAVKDPAKIRCVRAADPMGSTFTRQADVDALQSRVYRELRCSVSDAGGGTAIRRRAFTTGPRLAFTWPTTASPTA
jgi:hypothetical protein